MWTQEKSKNQKVIIPVNFSNTPVFETSEENILLTCISGIALIGTLLKSLIYL